MTFFTALDALSRRAAFVPFFTLFVVLCFNAVHTSYGFEPVRSGLMRVTTPAQKLEVELNGATDLYLYADYAGDSYDCDQAIWGEPTLIDADGRRVDLTTLRPESAQTGWGELLVNHNHQNKELRVGRTQFKTGFWAHAPSLLHFKLDKEYARFTTLVGLDTNGVRGSVFFQVRNEPVEMPKPEEYKQTNPRVTVPPIPKSSDSDFTFNPAAAQTLLDAGVEKLIFVRRYTYDSNHVYTDHVNCSWLPGAGFAILDLRTGQVQDLYYDQLHEGMIQRFDLSYDASKIVFDFRASPEQGYRIYEANLDGSGMKQLTFPQEDEAELVRKYKRGSYLHGTDDLHPCYLPDGGIVFVSTRAQFSVLCDASDNFTVTNLYRMDADGANLQPLTYSPLNEQSPAMLPDGRIIYHRWEYVDKAAGNAKALWAVNPDGTGASEIYGDNISFPESMLYPRPIPNSDNQIVFLGASHCCPNNALGTVIVIDAKDDARDVETMRYITNDVRAYHHNGFHFLDSDGQYRHDLTGVGGRLFKDPYPIAEDLFIASRKPAGLLWNDLTGYDLVLLDDQGHETELLTDLNAGCWHAYPILERDLPPVRSSVLDPQLAAQGKALCAITNVYEGLDGVARGDVKYIRVLEQVPRSWTARKSWGEDHDGTTHAHSAVGHGQLSVKVQLGVAPVEEDGSASFYVPADRALYFQALDENYRAIQTERTYVNYRPGERRACVGCHETQRDAPTQVNPVTPTALLREPSVLSAQPNQDAPESVFDYQRQIQPLWNDHCLQCHHEGDDSHEPILDDKPQSNYSRSYWNLVNLARTDAQLLGNIVPRNEDAASAGIEFVPPYQSGALSSPLAAWLFGETALKDAPEAAQNELKKLIDLHADAKIELSTNEKITLANWLDVNGQFHPSYFGRLHEKFQDRLDYRPEITPEEARSRVLPERIEMLYRDADAQATQAQ
ncbi:MAG: NPCBM/NEW2 domain-containing protein [Planctomycetia bacterium]|nr:NPCBM/NEW2 domain-containing protein [Planctomycetia bacterium]